MNKKLSSLILIILLALSVMLVACSGESDISDIQEEQQEQQGQNVSDNEQQPTATAVPTEKPTPTPTPDPYAEVRELISRQLSDTSSPNAYQIGYIIPMTVENENAEIRVLLDMITSGNINYIQYKTSMISDDPSTNTTETCEVYSKTTAKQSVVLLRSNEGEWMMSRSGEPGQYDDAIAELLESIDEMSALTDLTQKELSLYKLSGLKNTADKISVDYTVPMGSLYAAMGMDTLSDVTGEIGGTYTFDRATGKLDNVTCTAVMDVKSIISGVSEELGATLELLETIGFELGDMTISLVGYNDSNDFTANFDAIYSECNKPVIKTDLAAMCAAVDGFGLPNILTYENKTDWREDNGEAAAIVSAPNVIPDTDNWRYNRITSRVQNGVVSITDATLIRNGDLFVEIDEYSMQYIALDTVEKTTIYVLGKRLTNGNWAIYNIDEDSILEKFELDVNANQFLPIAAGAIGTEDYIDSFEIADYGEMDGSQAVFLNVTGTETEIEGSNFYDLYQIIYAQDKRAELFYQECIYYDDNDYEVGCDRFTVTYDDCDLDGRIFEAVDAEYNAWLAAQID